jgi:hypothetical protein
VGNTPLEEGTRMIRFIRYALVALACSHSAARGQEPMFRLNLGSEWLEGSPLASNESEVILLLRDGQWRDFRPSAVKEFKAVDSGFRPFGAAELRGQLLREFGQRFEVTGAGHYLVVHPAGQRDQWAPRFEELYRSFVHYFTARGWRPQEPRFPLIAVVYPRQVDFLEQARKEGVNPNGLLGYYSPKTNRILLFDSTSQNGGNWSLNAETIIHEATHQTAFNTGIHSRYGHAPRWVVEGLGTMFEARGVWDSRKYPSLADRVNRGRLQQYRRLMEHRKWSGIAEIVSSDRPFQTDVDAAYPEAWALTFFLCETEPKKYLQYVAKTSAIEPFSAYPSPKRLSDFTDVFGADLKLLDARMQRWLQGIK